MTITLRIEFMVYNDYKTMESYINIYTVVDFLLSHCLGFTHVDSRKITSMDVIGYIYEHIQCNQITYTCKTFGTSVKLLACLVGSGHPRQQSMSIGHSYKGIVTCISPTLTCPIPPCIPQISLSSHLTLE